MTTVVDGLAYPECPRWHEGALWVSDQHAGVVLRVEGRRPGVVDEVVTVPGGPAGLGWTPDGTLLVVSMHERRLLSLRPDGGLCVVADLAGLHPGLSNDLVTDGGTAYIGNIGFDYYAGEEPRTTVLAAVDVSEHGHAPPPVVAAGDLLVPNGMVVTGRTLVVAESFAHRLTGFTIATDGALVDRHVHADLGDDIPDGICLDAEGAIWFAAIGRHEVVRVLAGGRVAGRVSTGGREAVACALGGDHGDTLYVCTTAELDPARSLLARSGRVEAVTVGVPAAGDPA